MSEPKHNLLLADRPGPWRDSFADLLAAEELSVKVTDDGDLLYRTLVAPSGPPCSLIIIGQELIAPAGLDALWRASNTLRAEGRERRVASVMLLTDVKEDLELLQLLRTRGVDGFLSRSEPLNEVTNSVMNVLYKGARAHERKLTNLDSEMLLGGETIGGTIENLSPGGAQISFRAKKAAHAPAVGDELQLKFGIGNLRVEVKAIVRHVATRKKFFGDALVLGVQILPPDEDTLATLKRVLAMASELLEVQRAAYQGGPMGG